MDIPKADRQELEFAALLHDVGKIAIPKEILNKPAKLTDEEFELIKTHTIEGQVLLDRVGGLHGPGRRDRPLLPRALGRQGLPGRARAAGDPARGPDRLLLRRVQRDDHRPPVPQGDAPRGRRSPRSATTPARSSTRRWPRRSSASS